MAVELKAVIDLIGEYATDEAKAKEVASGMREHPVAKQVSQHLINVGNGGKAAELEPKMKELRTQVETLTATIATKDAEIEELGKKAPERKQIEQQEAAKWEARMKKVEGERDTAKTEAQKLRRESDLAILEAHLTKPNDQGIYVEPEVAKLFAKEHGARIVEREDGSRDVLQLDSDAPYDAKDHKAKLAALGADIRKRVPNVALLTSTDRGGGRDGGGGGGGGGSGTYDPQKVGTEMGKTEKTANETNLALK